MTVLEGLYRMREIMSDPDRVVLDPGNLSEDHEGNPAPLGDATRFCLVGSAWAVANGVPVSALLNQIYAVAGERDATAVLREGDHLEVIKRAIDMEREKLESFS